MIGFRPRRPQLVTIKNVGAFDLGRLARLHRACFDESWSRADLAHLLAMAGGFGLIARFFDGGFVGLDGMRGVGFALCRVTADESELLSIGVTPGYRRKRVGAELLRAAMDRCQRQGARLMFLEVATDNLSAQALYIANGFEQVGMRTDYYQRADGSRASAYTMRCELQRALEQTPATARAS